MGNWSAAVLCTCCGRTLPRSAPWPSPPAHDLGVRRVFCLTFETSFFAGHGFESIEGTPVDPQVYAELLRSYDEGVAEFLDLERVKPNTLENTRMLRRL